MTVLHPTRVADAAATAKLDPITLESLVKRTVWVMGATESLGDFTQGTGEIALAVASQATGQVYFYDSSDTTTPDDGVTCLVDGSGHRYFLEESTTIKVSSVLDLTDTPPGSPTIGDAYIVGTSPTGAWSGFANDIAICTRRGWVFAVPEIGTTVLNQATDLNTQFNDSAAWGAFDISLADGSVRPRALEWPLDGFAVESTTNTPIVSPTVGLYYIVGASPTGAWSGKAGKVATWYNSAWEFIDAYEGGSVFNRALGYPLYYKSGAWGGGAGSIDYQVFDTPGSFTWTKPALGTRAFVEGWGAGGSGGRTSTGFNYGGAGAGGSYVAMWFDLADLGATETGSVGAGGASVTSDGNGNAGGNSSFGAWLTAYGGGRGGGSASGVHAGGGGGGGQGSVGGNASAGTPGTAGTDIAGGTAEGSGGGGGATANDGSSAVTGGGGGGGDHGGNGGKSGWGGGGGGGGNNPGGTGGTSKFGGAGGAGNFSGSNATAGAQPGGGGGGSQSGNSGKGGDGLVKVTVF